MKDSRNNHKGILTRAAIVFVLLFYASEVSHAYPKWDGFLSGLLNKFWRVVVSPAQKPPTRPYKIPIYKLYSAVDDTTGIGQGGDGRGPGDEPPPPVH